MVGSNLCVRIWSSVSLCIYIWGSFPAKELHVQFMHRSKSFPCCHPYSIDFSYVVILRFQTVDYSDMLELTAEIEFHKSLPHAVIQCTPTHWLFLRVRMDSKDWFCTHFTLWPYLPYHVFYFLFFYFFYFWEIPCVLLWPYGTKGLGIPNTWDYYLYLFHRLSQTNL